MAWYSRILCRESYGQIDFVGTYRIREGTLPPLARDPRPRRRYTAESRPCPRLVGACLLLADVVRLVLDSDP